MITISFLNPYCKDKGASDSISSEEILGKQYSDWIERPGHSKIPRYFHGFICWAQSTRLCSYPKFQFGPRASLEIGMHTFLFGSERMVLSPNSFFIFKKKKNPSQELASTALEGVPSDTANSFRHSRLSEPLVD